MINKIAQSSPRKYKLYATYFAILLIFTQCARDNEAEMARRLSENIYQLEDGQNGRQNQGFKPDYGANYGAQNVAPYQPPYQQNQYQGQYQGQYQSPYQQNQYRGQYQEQYQGGYGYGYNARPSSAAYSNPYEFDQQDSGGGLPADNDRTYKMPPQYLMR